MPAQERAIRTRQNIMLAAATVFNERGYKAATIADILTTAGVTKGALYFHFPSKDDLAQEVLATQNRNLTIPERPSKTKNSSTSSCSTPTDPDRPHGPRSRPPHHGPTLHRIRPHRPLPPMGRPHPPTPRKSPRPRRTPPPRQPHRNRRRPRRRLRRHPIHVPRPHRLHDLTTRANALLRHLLPTITLPSILTSLDLNENRGAHVYTEIHTTTQKSRKGDSTEEPEEP